MGSIGAPELLIILAVLLLVFGGSQLPKLARSLGQASKEFKKGVNEGSEADEDDDTAGSGKSGKGKPAK